MSIRTTSILALCLGLTACAGGNGIGNDTATSGGPVAAPSGITSSNGGGQRQLGNMPSVGITNGVGTVTSVPNTKGNAY